MKIFRVILLFLILISLPGIALAASGYKIYVGTTTGVYAVSTTDVGLVQSWTVMGLTPGQVYYFAATAYIESLESGYSNEVNATVGSTGQVGLAWDISTDVPILRRDMFFFNF
jgi:hypothetical protein